MLRPATARAPVLIILAPDEPRPCTVGENEVPCAPLVPATVPDAWLLPCAELPDCPLPPEGALRDVLCEPSATCAIEPVEAPVMLRPASARAPLLCTPETKALAPEPVGENELPLPEPLVPATEAELLEP